jgi:hypothetical protein
MMPSEIDLSLRNIAGGVIEEIASSPGHTTKVVAVLRQTCAGGRWVAVVTKAMHGALRTEAVFHRHIVDPVSECIGGALVRYCVGWLDE